MTHVTDNTLHVMCHSEYAILMCQCYGQPIVDVKWGWEVIIANDRCIVLHR